MLGSMGWWRNLLSRRRWAEEEAEARALEDSAWAEPTNPHFDRERAAERSRKARAAPRRARRIPFRSGAGGPPAGGGAPGGGEWLRRAAEPEALDRPPRSGLRVRPYFSPDWPHLSLGQGVRRPEKGLRGDEERLVEERELDPHARAFRYAAFDRRTGRLLPDPLSGRSVSEVCWGEPALMILQKVGSRVAATSSCDGRLLLLMYPAGGGPPEAEARFRAHAPEANFMRPGRVPGDAWDATFLVGPARQSGPRLPGDVREVLAMERAERGRGASPEGRPDSAGGRGR